MEQLKNVVENKVYKCMVKQHIDEIKQVLTQDALKGYDINGEREHTN